MKQSFWLLALLAVTACTEPAPTTTTSAESAEVKSATILPGCYLGHQSGPGDTIALRLDTATGGVIAGAMQILIEGKDSRVGGIHGVTGADGILRAKYVFMQEGVLDSIDVQFRAPDGTTKALLMRPSTYDAATGREYPDSSQRFTIALQPGVCNGEIGGKDGLSKK